MPKRFTENSKWNDPWFRRLKPKYKCFWIYLCDMCDPAGVWNEDMEAASFHVGEKISHSEAVMALEGRIDLFDYKNETHWLLPSFISFQYKELKENHNPHLSVFKSLEKYNLRVDQGLTKGSQGSLMDKDKDKDKDKGQDKDKDEKKDITHPSWREDFNVYMQEQKEALKQLAEDKEWIANREEFHPRLDIYKSMKKSYVDFWGKESGWLHKKRKKLKSIDWKATYANALTIKANQVWKS